MRAVTVKEICKIKSGKRIPNGYDFSYCITEHPYIRARDIKNGKINTDDLIYVDDNVFEKIRRYIINTGDIAITIVGASIGDIGYASSNVDGFCLTENAVRLTEFDDDVNPRYVFYYLNSDEGQTYMKQVAGGAAQPKLGIYKIEIIPLLLPEKRIQDKISDILSAYDNLIENNQKQIKLLEEAAQRLYKEWFVDLHFPGYENTEIIDGVPKGWSKLAISQMGTYTNGFAFKPTDWQNKGIPIIKIKEMGNGISKDTPRNNGERVPKKYLIKSGDILFSWSATLSAMIWNNSEGWLNQHIFKVEPNENISREFLLQSILNTIDEFKNLTSGSTMKHIQRGKLDQVYIKVPTEKVMNKFNDLADNIREEILTLSKKNVFLSEARDRLLPKLMSGELEV